MPSKKVEDYAYKHQLSFGAAKRRMGLGARRDTVVETIARNSAAAKKKHKAK